MALRGDNKVITEQWEKVKELFEAALESAPRERTAFLANLRREHPSLAGQVSGLLASYEKAGDFLQQPLVFSSDFLDDLEEPQRFSPNDVLCDRFKIIRLVGKGGMGEVYEAHDQELDERVALKTLRYDVSSNEVFTARFRREIQLARKVTHPNVCRIFESLRHQAGNETVSVLSMELLQGVTLNEYLKSKGRLGTEEALPLARQIIEGLSAVHAAGIIHRDLKPSNLVLVPEGEGFRVKITDFGIAGRLPENPSQPALTQASKMLGTPDYMAPEQLERGRADIQSDIYALGVVLYEMVTGAKPFSDTGAWKRLYEEPRPPRKLVSDLPEHWNKTIICCLERNPAYRFADAAAVAEGLSGDAAAGAIPRKPLSRRLQNGLIVALSALAMALFLLILRYYRQSPQIPAGTRVLVTDIATSDPTLAGLTVALKSQLAQSAHFEVEEESKIVETLKQMDRNPGDSLDARTAREVAWRSGVPLVVSGSLLASGDGYLLSMRVEQIKHNPLFPSVTWKNAFSASNKSELLSAVHDASSWVRRLAGETAEGLAEQDRPVEDTTTGSWRALQLYTSAEKQAAVGATDSALVMLREAIQTDNNFAKARMRLADILVSQKDFAEGYAQWKEAIRLMDKRQLTSREALRLEGQFYEDTGNYIQAEKKFHEYAVHYPNDYLAWFFWGSALDTMGHLDDAVVAFENAAKLKPAAFAPHEHLATLYLKLKRFEAARHETDKVRALGGAEWAIWLSAQLSFLGHDDQQAIEQIRTLRLSKSSQWQSMSYVYEADWQAETDHIGEASFVLGEGITFDQLHGRFSDEAEKEISLAYIFLHQKDLPKARRFALEAVTQKPELSRIAEAGTVLARAGFLADAKSLAVQINRSSDVYARTTAGACLAGEIAVGEHITGLGLKKLAQCSESAPPGGTGEHLAHGYFRAGSIDAAKEAYRKLAHQREELSLNPNLREPGLWSDATLQYLKLTGTSPDSNDCAVLQEWLKLRDTRTLAGNLRLSQIPSALLKTCGNNHKPKH